jgi:hypothetical protein
MTLIFLDSNYNNIMPIGPCRRYAPKSLIIISKFDYYELFKSILSLIYGIYVDNRDVKLEDIIGNLLLVNINSPGRLFPSSLF